MESLPLLKNAAAEKFIDHSAASKIHTHLDFIITECDKVHGASFESLFSPLERKENYLLKIIFDFIASTLLILCIFLLLLPFIALLIKIDSKGPVFFLQKRSKKEGKVFTCIKFRTMIVNEKADTLPAYENDVRITRAGKFLRKTHLDELPQLLNVWLGDMSLIGPRPYMINENLYYQKVMNNYNQRHSVKPGITGLAQSLGYFGCSQNEKEIQKRIDLDLLYIRDWSIKMDIKILYRTLLMSLKNK